MSAVTFDPDVWLYEEERITGLSAEGETLAQVELYHCEVHAAKLTGATLRRWVFEACSFIDCDLSNVTFEGCTFTACRFIDCRLIGSDWRQVASLTAEVSFEGCDLSYSQLSGVTLQGAQLSDTRCHEVDFNQSKLARACFQGSDVAGASFSGADLSDADLTGAEGEQFDPKDCHMRGALVSVHTATRLVEEMGLRVQLNAEEP